MKTLCIIRHAKSSWEDEALADIDRPLAKRGINDAAIMAKLLLSNHDVPDLLLSSPAVRAKSTAAIFCKAFGIDQSAIVIEEVLYFGELSAVISLLQSIGSGAETVFIFGHNPTFSNLASALCPEFYEEMPTCGIVKISFPVENWALVQKGSGKLAAFEYPKKYR